MSNTILVTAAEEDSENTKLRHGGQKTVKRYTRDIMCVDQTSHLLLHKLPDDQPNP